MLDKRGIGANCSTSPLEVTNLTLNLEVETGTGLILENYNHLKVILF